MLKFLIFVFLMPALFGCIVGCASGAPENIADQMGAGAFFFAGLFGLGTYLYLEC
jgi:hypothetical protein